MEKKSYRGKEEEKMLVCAVMDRDHPAAPPCLRQR
jgi:hypothetical protein